MKNLFTLLLVCVCGFAFAQIETPPQASSAGSVSSRIGLTDVKVDYSRPKMKGRKIFGQGDGFLVPYGAIWRTGANAGTKITFSDDVKVEGTTVPKGEYLIFSWPGASEWVIALYNNLTIGGNTDAYDKTKEQLRFTVKSEKLAETISTFTIAISDISDDNTSGKVQIAWENTSVKFTVTADYDARMMASIQANTKVNPANLSAAARYYLDNKKDPKQALVWINQYVADPANPNMAQNLYLKATIQKAAGDKAGAIATAQKSLELSKAAKNDFYVGLNEDLIKGLK